nr:MAG TPA: hypothetical protein [Caudoviricetes sp.]
MNSYNHAPAAHLHLWQPVRLVLSDNIGFYI